MITVEKTGCGCSVNGCKNKTNIQIVVGGEACSTIIYLCESHLAEMIGKVILFQNKA